VAGLLAKLRQNEDAVRDVQGQMKARVSDRATLEALALTVRILNMDTLSYLIQRVLCPPDVLHPSDMRGGAAPQVRNHILETQNIELRLRDRAKEALGERVSPPPRLTAPRPTPFQPAPAAPSCQTAARPTPGRARTSPFLKSSRSCARFRSRPMTSSV